MGIAKLLSEKISPIEGLTFDDVLLLPGYTDFTRQDIKLSSKLTKHITLNLPLVAAPMDTVTENKLAIALAQAGGIGIIHRNLTVMQQAAEVKKVKVKKLLVGAAVGASKGYGERAQALVQAGVDVIVIDSAHGFTKGMIAAIKHLKKTFPRVDIIAGNIATYEAAKSLALAGADGLRVGMGPGAICTTRIISGMGIPQIAALSETIKVGIPVIADGGIKYSGDMTKALAMGASTIMMGNFFASALESPGKTIRLKKDHVPKRFQSILNGSSSYLFKQYRGMGSEAAMKEGAKVKSEGEFHGKDYKDRVLIAEGIEGYVPVKGTVRDIVDQAIGGVMSGMYYVGAKTIGELWKKAKFVRITPASLTESHPHSVLVSNFGKNY